MKKGILLIILFFCFNIYGFSQEKFIVQNKKHSDKIRFKLINNLVIIPVEINGVTLSFILDTGVSKPIIFNFLNITDSLNIKNTKKIFLRGLGEGESVEALQTKNNVLKIGDAIKLNQDIYQIYDANLNFTPRLGIPIHGIIGYDILKDLVVEINYSNHFIKLTEPTYYNYGKCNDKCQRLNLEFYRNKPYINCEVGMGGNQIPVKLLIDSGGSDALWLFEDDSLGIKSSDKYFYDFLGHGLSGSVYGKRSKIESFSLKNFTLKNANVAFPDSTYILHARKFKERNGSLGGNVLKRFNIIIDYKRAIITLNKNNYFRDKFSYNKSGIELEHDGLRVIKENDNSMQKPTDRNSNNIDDTRIVIVKAKQKISLEPAYTIVELRINSPAEKAGLEIGDVILAINNKPAHQFSLQELMYVFYDEAGKKIKLKVDRYGQILNFNFQLENLF